jgi:hypothetical protein
MTKVRLLRLCTLHTGGRVSYTASQVKLLFPRAHQLFLIPAFLHLCHVVGVTATLVISMSCATALRNPPLVVHLHRPLCKQVAHRVRRLEYVTRGTSGSREMFGRMDECDLLWFVKLSYPACTRTVYVLVCVHAFYSFSTHIVNALGLLSWCENLSHDEQYSWLLSHALHECYSFNLNNQS